MLDLAPIRERMEKATGPDRELDLAIERAVNTSSIHDDHLDRFPDAAKHYTASIDAALTLFGDYRPRGLHLYTNSAPDMGGKDWIVSHQSPTARYVARSWPIAICMAALVARSSLSTTKEGK